MTETDKRLIAVWKSYFDTYSKFYPPSFASACASERADRHIDLYKLELDVRLAEAKARVPR